MQKVTHRLPGSRPVVETASLPMSKQDYVVKHSYHLAILLCILQAVALVYIARDGLKVYNVNEAFRWWLAAFFTTTSAIGLAFRKGNYLIPTVLGYCAIIVFFLLGACYTFLVALYPELFLIPITTSHQYPQLILNKRFDCFMSAVVTCIGFLVAASLTSWPLVVNMLAIQQMESEKKKPNSVILAASENNPA